MFLCAEHHDPNCPMGWLEELMTSRGPCEICRKTAVCFDCQGYKIQKVTP